MDASGPEKIAQLPDEMLSFTILKSAAAAAPRLGRLALPGRKLIETPGFISNTSRGVVPHLSPDNLRSNTRINGAYFALEDFLEKANDAVPPIYQTHSSRDGSPLRDFCGIPNEVPLILGARRAPAIPCPKANTNTAVSILTSFGFRQLDTKDYAAATRHLRPDVVVGLGDIVFDKQTISSKRMEKMSDRTGAWTRTLAEACRDSEQNRTAPPHIFAPILPIASQLQSYYTNQLLDDDTLRDSVQGLAMYDAGSVLDLPKQSSALPRLMLTESPGPAKLLQEVSLGADLFVIPFIGAATDAGIALGFQFPPPSAVNGNARRPLGMDMWQSEHALDLSPLAPYCECYSCKKHHRAYLYHLLSTKEMLAWVLLQIHNHHILDRFFAGVRDSIAKETFEKDKHAFEKFYEPELPEKTGQGPRLRGYQVKSEGRGEPKKNPKAYGRLDDAQVKFAEGVAPSLDVDGVDLEKDGLASVIE